MGKNLANKILTCAGIVSYHDISNLYDIKKLIEHSNTFSFLAWFSTRIGRFESGSHFFFTCQAVEVPQVAPADCHETFFEILN